MTFELDRDGGAQVLKEEFADAIKELALQIGAAADEGAKASEYSQIDDKITDRIRATVSVPAERQARLGVLTKAAAAAGLEVVLYSTTSKRGRPPKATKAAA